MELSSKRRKANRASEKKPVSKSTGRAESQYKAATPLNRRMGRAAYKLSEVVSHLKEPEVGYTSKIRAIGNSKGVILNNQVIETAGLAPDQDIIIQASMGIITIMQVKETGVNSDLSNWDKQFKSAIKKGAKPGGDLFAGIENEFDSKEW